MHDKHERFDTATVRTQKTAPSSQNGLVPYCYMGEMALESRGFDDDCRVLPGLPRRMTMRVDTSPLPGTPHSTDHCLLSRGKLLTASVGH